LDLLSCYISLLDFRRSNPSIIHSGLLRIEFLAAMPYSLDGKPAPALEVIVVDLTSPGEISQVFRDQNVQILDSDRSFVVFWLIQSQPQTGPSSAESLDYYTDELTRIFSQDFFNLTFRYPGYFNHLPPPILRMRIILIDIQYNPQSLFLSIQ
jgi:hypothetical protein